MKDETGSTNNWWDPKKAHEKLFNISKDSYIGKTMYITSYSMGHTVSKFSKI